MSHQDGRMMTESPETHGEVGVLIPRPASSPADVSGLSGPHRGKALGFTLIEMLVSISIVLILAVIVTASFQSIMTSVRMTSEINGLQQGFNLARSEAIKRGQSVSVCPGTATSTVCGTGTDWSAGWIVFLSGPATVLLVSPGVTHNDTLTSTSVQATPYPVFTPIGYTFFSDTLTLHDSSSTQSLYQCIVFSAGSWVIKTAAACP